jgi:hypothetical protein
MSERGILRKDEATMAKARFHPEQIIPMLREAEVEIGEGDGRFAKTAACRIRIRLSAMGSLFCTRNQ